MKYCKKNKFAILLIFILPYSGLFPQKLDPLLQRPWIEEITREEEKFYNRLSNIITKRKHYFIKKDRFGREFKIKWNGEIQFLLNDFYKEVFPDFDQLDVHLAESKNLSENGNYIEPIRLLKGINLCNRLILNNNISDKPKNYEYSTKILNSLLSKFGHKEDKINNLTDPYGCYFSENEKSQKRVFLESEPFAFRLQIGADFRYNFPSDELEISGKENDFSWKIFRMVKSIPNADEKLNDFDEELKKSAKNLLNLREDKIILFIGMTFHFSSFIYTKDNYYLLWDMRRGLTKNRMRQIEFKREKIGNYYEGTFQQISESGEKNTIGVKEKYFLRKNKGLFFSLSYPIHKKIEANEEWSIILKSLDVK